MLTRKIKLCHINAHITCRLCEGYLIDATTVTECLHTCEFHPLDHPLQPFTFLYVCNKRMCFIKAHYAIIVEYIKGKKNQTIYLSITIISMTINCLQKFLIMTALRGTLGEHWHMGQGQDQPWWFSQRLSANSWFPEAWRCAASVTLSVANTA